MVYHAWQPSQHTSITAGSAPTGSAVRVRACAVAVALWPGSSALLGTPPAFSVRVASETETWGSFVTSDLWRNLPGPWIAGLTFLVCGFAVVYLVGSRSFCRLSCDLVGSPPAACRLRSIWAAWARGW